MMLALVDILKSFRSPSRLVRKVNEIARSHREKERYHAYYAVPVLIGFGVTYGLIQLLTLAYPEFHFSYRDYHIHHYTYGIVLLLIFGYVGIWTRSIRMKLVCALAYGVGVAFIVDEAWMWFTLNQNAPQNDFDLAFFILAALIGLFLAPVLYDGWKTENR